MELFYIITFLVAHFVGDFIFQSDWMAVNKRKSWFALLMHTLGYGAGFLLVCFVATIIGGIVYDISIFSRMLDFNIFFGFVILTHGIQDFFTSRLNHWLTNYGKHWFFVGVGFDQMLHYIIIFSLWVGLVGKL